MAIIFVMYDRHDPEKKIRNIKDYVDFLEEMACFTNTNHS